MKFKKNMILVVLLVAPILFTGSFKLFSQDTMNIHKTDNTIISIPTSEIEKITYGNLEPVPSGNTVKDIDGNVYNTVKIGTQTWMQSDLKVTKFNNGTPIALIQENKSWKETTAAAYSWYDNKMHDANSPYGAIYNGFAAEMKTLCPKGWHVSSKEEWEILTKYCGIMGVDSPRKLKEAGTAHWLKNPKSVTNETGFTALPNGYRRNHGDFNFRGESGGWWTATEKTTSLGPTLFKLTIYASNSPCAFGHFAKQHGFCVRCIKDEY